MKELDWTKPMRAGDIESPFNACMHRFDCNAMKARLAELERRVTHHCPVCEAREKRLAEAERLLGDLVASGKARRGKQTLWEISVRKATADSAAREPFHDALCERRDANVYACCCDLRKSRRADSAPACQHKRRVGEVSQGHTVYDGCADCGADLTGCIACSGHLVDGDECPVCHRAAHSADVCINCGRPDGTGPCRKCEFPPASASGESP